MKKLFFLTILAGSMVLFASDAPKAQKTIIFDIFMEQRKDQDNPVAIATNNLIDKMDKFSSDILGIEWPTGNELKGDSKMLWRIQKPFYKKEGDDSHYRADAMLIKNFTSKDLKNPYLDLETAFAFPQVLPYAFAQELARAKQEGVDVIRETENARVIFRLQNSLETLQNLGLLPRKTESTIPSKVGVESQAQPEITNKPIQKNPDIVNDSSKNSFSIGRLAMYGLPIGFLGIIAWWFMNLHKQSA